MRSGALLWERVLEQAGQAPERTALRDGAGQHSYRELAAAVKAASARLGAMGVGAGDPVLNTATPDFAYAAAVYGIQRAGAIHVPVENRAPAARLAELASQVGAKLIISPEDPCCGVPWMPAETLLTWEGEDVDPTPDPAACAEIIYTTGTTGASKGVMLSGAALSSYVETVNPSFGLDGETVFLICTPLNHAGGLRRLHMTLSAGGTAVLTDGMRDLRRFFETVRLAGVNATYLPPASVRLLLSLAAEEFGKLDGRLRFIYTASSAFPLADMERLSAMMRHTRLYQGYGGSEIGAVSNYVYNAPGAVIDCLGRPHPGVELRLEDEDGSPVKRPGQPGRISVRSPMNMMGYLNAPELTASVLSADGFIRTSDIGVLDAEGRLFFRGRSGDVINVGGFKVDPAEVEAAALRCPQVADCVCTGRERRLGTVLELRVVPSAGEQFRPQEIAAELRRTLEPYKVPSRIVETDRVPRTFNGKIDRKAVRGV